jgi:hypothetical protein
LLRSKVAWGLLASIFFFICLFCFSSFFISFIYAYKFILLFRLTLRGFWSFFHITQCESCVRLLLFHITLYRLWNIIFYWFPFLHASTFSSLFFSFFLFHSIAHNLCTEDSRCRKCTRHKCYYVHLIYGGDGKHLRQGLFNEKIFIHMCVSVCEDGNVARRNLDEPFWSKLKSKIKLSSFVCLQSTLS